MFFQTITSSLLCTFKLVTTCSSRKGKYQNVDIVEMRKCQTKARFRHIHKYSGIFRHIQTYPDIIRLIQVYLGIIQVYSEPCVALVFRFLLYSESWHMQNRRHIQNLCISKILVHSEKEACSESWAIQIPEYSEPEAYSEPCQTSTMEHFEKQLMAIIIFASHNYFCNISFSCPLVHEINTIF